MNGHVRQGSAAKAPEQKKAERAPRRVVLLAGDENSEVAEVLSEYTGNEASGVKVHGDLARFAAAHPGKVVAAEWLGPLGWTRFLWGRK
jgi:hypothetical protein